MYKIIFFAKDIRGGTDTFLRQLGLLDSKKFNKIFCFFRKDQDAIYDKNRVILNETYPEGPSFSLKKLSIFITNIPKTYYYIKSENPQLLFTCDTYSYLTIVFLKFFCFKKIPLVALVNNNIYLINQKRHSFLYSKLIFALMEISSKVPEGFVFVSKDLAKITTKTIGIMPRRIEIIPHSLDLTKVRSLLKEKFTKGQRELIGDKREFKIFSVGRLDQQKDFRSLLNGFSLVLKEIPSCRLIILGDGELRQNLERQVFELGIGRNVVFAGWQKNIYKFLKYADLFILSSNYEGFPITILEAMASGVPVISTDSPTGPREILGNGKYGVLIKVGDYKKMAAMAVELLNNKPLRRHYRKIGLKRVRMFNTQKKQYEALFSEILES